MYLQPCPSTFFSSPISAFSETRLVHLQHTASPFNRPFRSLFYPPVILRFISLLRSLARHDLHLTICQLIRAEVSQTLPPMGLAHTIFHHLYRVVVYKEV